MTLQFLGTGPSRPIVNQRGRSRRRQSAALVTHAGYALLIDAGPSIVQQCRRCSVFRIDAVVLTHRHQDAAGGLGALDRWVRGPVPVFVGPGERPRYRAARFRRLSLTEFWTGRPFLRAPLSVWAFPVHHASDPRTFPTHGFHLRAGGMRVTYVSDVKAIPPASRRFFQGNDLLIVDGAGWTRDLPNHRGILNHVDQYVRAGNRRVLFTQIGRAVPAHARATRALRRLSPRAALAHDGLRVPL